MPKHIVNLLLLLGFFMLLAFAAKDYLTDPSFYKYGHYRADSVPELAAGEPLYKGVVYCLECHEEREADWSTGAHVTVKCEVCHGTDHREHPDDGKTLIPAETIRLCINCHEEMPARPARQPQIVVAGHPFPDEERDQCHSCHDPHAPQDDEATAAPDTEAPTEAPTGSLIYQPDSVRKCAKCHGKNGEGRRKNPALAGLETTVFIERMNMYISGERDNKKMAKAARLLSEEDIEELARYYESLPAPPTEKTD